MENNFFEVNSHAAFEDGFWKWLFQWINYPGKCPAIENVARRLLDRMLGERKPVDYSSIEVLTCPKVRLLLLVNEEIAVILNHRSLTIQRRQDLLQIRKDLMDGVLQGVNLAAALENIYIVFFDFALPVNSMRKSLLPNEALILEDQIEALREVSASGIKQKEIDDEFFMRNPVDTILPFSELLEFLRAGEYGGEDSVYMGYLQHLQMLSQLSDQWSTLSPCQWSIEAAQGFARYLEENRPETAWGLEAEGSLCIHYNFFPVPDEFLDLKEEISGLGFDLCNNGPTNQWEYLIVVYKVQKALPYTVLWAVYHQLKERLTKLDFPCYKKRFLPRTAVPVIAVPMYSHCIEYLDKIERELYQIDWGQIQDSLNDDSVAK